MLVGHGVLSATGLSSEMRRRRIILPSCQGQKVFLCLSAMLKAAEGRERGQAGGEGEAEGKHVVDVQSGQGVWEERGEAAVGMRSRM